MREYSSPKDIDLFSIKKIQRLQMHDQDYF